MVKEEWNGTGDMNRDYMKGALPETIKIAEFLLNDEQINIIQKILEESELDPINYSVEEYWKLDYSVGGIGGYCMPTDPCFNPFPAGIGRTLFRPLQYAYSQINSTDLKRTARYIIQDSGSHLEDAVRYYLQNSKIFGLIRYTHNNTTLGKATSILDKSKMFPENLIKGLYLFVPIYNKSKHEVNQDEERERLFAPIDALVAYLSARILGKEILKMYYPKILSEIDVYIERLDKLNLKTESLGTIPADSN